MDTSVPDASQGLFKHFNVFTYWKELAPFTNQCQHFRNKYNCLILKSKYPSRLQQLSGFIFPIALCSSSNENMKWKSTTPNSAEMDVGNETSLSLPGLQSRSIRSGTQTVGEFEINQVLQTMTGWDRVREMYKVQSGQFQDEGTQALNTMFYRTVVVGFFINTISESAKRDKVTKSLSRSQAVLKGMVSRVMLPKTILKTALKDTFRLSFLAFSLLYVSQTISAYRNKTTVWEYIVASAIGVGSMGLPQGAARCAKFTLGGAVFGAIGGYVICQVLQNEGLTQEMRTVKKMEQRLKDQRMHLSAEEGL